MGIDLGFRNGNRRSGFSRDGAAVKESSRLKPLLQEQVGEAATHHGVAA
jgi:hypothetical protein